MIQHKHQDYLSFQEYELIREMKQALLDDVSALVQGHMMHNLYYSIYQEIIVEVIEPIKFGLIPDRIPQI